MRSKILMTLCVAALLAACGGAATTSAAAITIEEAWARPSPMVDGAGAAYFIIENTGAADDKLLSVTSDVSMMVELHETKDVNGMMEMSPVESILVPANGQAELKPGGYHVMLMKLNHELQPGEQIKLVLNFEKAGAVEVMCEVRDE